MAGAETRAMELVSLEVPHDGVTTRAMELFAAFAPFRGAETRAMEMAIISIPAPLARRRQVICVN